MIIILGGRDLSLKDWTSLELFVRSLFIEDGFALGYLVVATLLFWKNVVFYAWKRKEGEPVVNL